MPRRTTPALSKAVEILRLMVRQYTSTGMDALPPVTELAVRCGVAHATAWKAVRVLQAEGLVRAQRGSGTYVVRGRNALPTPAHAERAAAPLPPVQHRWEQVRDRIVQDYLVRLAGRHEFLPGRKVLAARYGTSLRTVRRSVEALVTLGRVHPERRRYRMEYTPAGVSSRSLVLVWPSRADGMIAFRFPNEEENLRRLEKECSARGLTLHVLTVSQDGQSISSPSPRRLEYSGEQLHRLEPLGYLLWLPGNAGHNIANVLRLIPAGRTPMAVGATRIHLRAYLGNPSRRPVRAFCTSEYGREAGAAVARYLLAHGHREVVCVVPRLGDPVVDERLAGLTEELEAAGDDARVYVCRYGPGSRPPRRVRRAQADVVQLVLQKAREHATWSRQDEQVAAAVLDAQPHVRSSLEAAELARHVRAAYRQLRGTEGATAIVAYNDPCAVACLGMLRAADVAVPEQMSLVSFDDTTLASLADIVSYDFNDAAVLLSMLDWVVWPDMRRSRRIQPPPVGSVTQRGTVSMRRAS